MYKIEGENLSFDNEEFFEIMRPFEIGSHAELYKLRIGNQIYAVKLFNGIYEEDLENYRNKLKLDIKSFVSPKKILYINNKFRGYIMDFIKDKNLMDRNLDISIGDFATDVVNLMDDTRELSKLKFCIYDAFLTNVMYEKGFKLIDIDPYTYEERKSLNEINDINSLRLNKMFLDVFLKNTHLISSVFAYIQNRQIDIKDKRVNKLFLDCDNGNISFEEFFNEICVMAYNVADNELEKIEDIGKVLRKI